MITKAADFNTAAVNATKAWEGVTKIDTSKPYGGSTAGNNAFNNAMNNGHTSDEYGLIVTRIEENDSLVNRSLQLGEKNKYRPKENQFGTLYGDNYSFKMGVMRNPCRNKNVVPELKNGILKYDPTYTPYLDNGILKFSMNYTADIKNGIIIPNDSDYLTSNNIRIINAWVGSCTANGTDVFSGAAGASKLATYPKLNAGNLVDIIGESGTRYQVRIAAKYIGYVEKSNIKNPNTPAATTTKKYPFVGKVTASKLNVRKKPGTEHPLLPEYPMLNKDNLINVLGVTKDTKGDRWYKVSITKNEYVGYISAKYITKA